MRWDDAPASIEPMLIRLNTAWQLFDDLVESQNIELLVENLRALSDDALRDVVLQRVLSEQERRRLFPERSRPNAGH